jgi:transcription elongation factor GreA-like protein
MCTGLTVKSESKMTLRRSRRRYEDNINRDHEALWLEVFEARFLDVEGLKNK